MKFYNKLKHTCSNAYYLSKFALILRKNDCFYEYMQSLDKSFLPSTEDFYSNLNMKGFIK